jgi:preprotein translocase subunit Sec61beta
MAQQQGGSLPSSQGGLVQYFDADSGVEIDPKTVIMLSGLLIAFELVMKSPLV